MRTLSGVIFPQNDPARMCLLTSDICDAFSLMEGSVVSVLVTATVNLSRNVLQMTVDPHLWRVVNMSVVQLTLKCCQTTCGVFGCKGD